MNILVKYIDFHWDNYQGASGKIIESQVLIDIPGDIKVIQILGELYEQLDLYIKERRPFPSKEKYTVKSIEVV